MNDNELDFTCLTWGDQVFDERISFLPITVDDNISRFNYDMIGLANNEPSSVETEIYTDLLEFMKQNKQYKLNPKGFSIEISASMQKDISNYLAISPMQSVKSMYGELKFGDVIIGEVKSMHIINLFLTFPDLKRMAFNAYKINGIYHEPVQKFISTREKDYSPADLTIEMKTREFNLVYLQSHEGLNIYA